MPRSHRCVVAVVVAAVACSPIGASVVLAKESNAGAACWRPLVVAVVDLLEVDEGSVATCRLVNRTTTRPYLYSVNGGDDKTELALDDDTI
jgi:hypothetical protein